MSYHLWKREVAATRPVLPVGASAESVFSKGSLPERKGSENSGGRFDLHFSHNYGVLLLKAGFFLCSVPSKTTLELNIPLPWQRKI